MFNREIRLQSNGNFLQSAYNSMPFSNVKKKKKNSKNHLYINSYSLNSRVTLLSIKNTYLILDRTNCGSNILYIYTRLLFQISNDIPE